MHKIPTIIRYLLVIIVVAILGAFAGWYVFVQRQIKTTALTDTARGFGENGTFQGTIGSGFTNQDTAQGFTTATSGPISTQTGNPAPRLWHVVKTPVAGAAFASSSPTLYFAERSSGNILTADPSVQGVTRLTNTLFPKIYEAYFGAHGAILLRSQTDDGTITTFAGTIGTSTPGSAAALEGVYLPQNIVAISARASSPVIFALIENPHGGVIGVTTDWLGHAQKQVFTSALSQWRAYFLEDGTIDIAQKAADGVPGDAFIVKGSALTPILSGLPGLVILPRASSTALIYSTSANGAIALFARSAASSTAVKLPIQTLAEKCVWARGRDLIAYCAVPTTRPNGDYERSWYQGKTHSSDAWWKVDVSAGTATQIYTQGSDGTIDVMNPVIDPMGSYIAFMDAVDNSLWMLRIAE